MTRAAPTYTEAVTAAADALRAHLKPTYGGIDDHEEAVRVVVRAYDSAAKAFKAKRKYFSPFTRRIAAMLPGQVIHSDPGANPCVVHSNFASARKLMQNEKAAWTTETLPSGEVKITRLADGARRPPIVRSPTTRAFVEMKVGDSKIVDGIDSRGGGSPNFYRRQARRVLGKPTATWALKRTSLGTRVTRTA